jgi:hypothetical protein
MFLAISQLCTEYFLTSEHKYRRSRAITDGRC